MKMIYFISRDANWQLYRNEVLSYLAESQNINVKILTTGSLKSYLKNTDKLKYVIFSDLFKNKRKVNFFPSALIYIYKNRPDCVIGQNGALNLTEYFSLIICRILGIKFIWWTRAYEHKPVKNKILRNLRQIYVNFFLKSANAIIVYSQIGYDFLIKIGYEKNKIHLALNTLDTDKLNRIREILKKDFNRKDFMLKEFPTAKAESKFILFVGRINKFKKVHNLVLAMKHIVNVRTDIHLIIIGDGDEKPYCEQITKDLRLENYVHFLGPIYQEETVNKYFELADIYSIPGSVGLGIIHAFSFGLPLVTENINYHSAEIQFLKNGYNGLLVPEDDVSMLANTFLKLLGNKSLLKQYSENALKTIAEDASIDTMITSYSKAIFS